MRCQACQSMNSHVTDSRPLKGRVSGVRRRRECLDCDDRWTTFERNEAEIPHDVTVALALSLLEEVADVIDYHPIEPKIEYPVAV